jgi:hypothetical protein
MPKKITIKKRSALCKLRRHSKRKPHRKHSSRRYGGSLRKKLNSKKLKIVKRRGGGIIPSGITQIGYSIIGTGQEVLDGWNGEPSAYASVNPSPEVQMPVNGSYYKSTHGI